MRIEVATPADASEISELIVGLSEPFYTSPSRIGAEPFLASVSPEAERSYLSAENFRYYVARSEGKLAGVVALRDNSHLFHLFVAKSFQKPRRALSEDLADAITAFSPSRNRLWLDGCQADCRYVSNRLCSQIARKTPRVIA